MKEIYFTNYGINLPFYIINSALMISRQRAYAFPGGMVAWSNNT